ncbi:hypothetical protein Q8A73_005796 [Channa argus]|nr:hypothetical protein Q8A73_005796 [Channa argus]
MEPAQGAITLEENAVLSSQLEEKSRAVQSLSKLLLECVGEETKKEAVRQREVQAPVQTLDDCNKARKKQQADGGSVKVGSVEQMFNKRSQRNGYEAEEEEKVSVNSVRSSDSEGEEANSAFLARAQGEWLDHTGMHLHVDQVQETMFRGAVLAGVPKTVKDAMEANPDIAGCNTETWERHLLHHLQRYVDEEEQASKEKADLEV